MDSNLTFRGRILLTFLLAVSLAAALSDYASAQQKPTPTGQLLQKTAGGIDVKSTANARWEITIRLYGLQPVDLVNIRPKAATLSVSAGTLVKSTRISARIPQEKIPYEAVSPGSPLPDSSLEVTSGQVTFFRPIVLDNIVFLDIEVPLRARVRVMEDDELVLRSIPHGAARSTGPGMGRGCARCSGSGDACCHAAAQQTQSVRSNRV